MTSLEEVAGPYFSLSPPGPHQLPFWPFSKEFLYVNYMWVRKKRYLHSSECKRVPPPWCQ